MNPEDASAESLAGWRELGFDRISLGLQALDDSALRFLGRRHDAGEARASVGLAREAGFRSVSIDLIYSLPGFDADWWLRTLDEAAALGPDHISCYELTIHDGTPFGRRRDAGRLWETGEDERAANFVATHLRLAELGYEGYEVSNFARTGGGSESAQPEVLAASALSGTRTLVALLRRSQPVVERCSVEGVERCGEEGRVAGGGAGGTDGRSTAAGSGDDGTAAAVRRRLRGAGAAVR